MATKVKAPEVTPGNTENHKNISRRRLDDATAKLVLALMSLSDPGVNRILSAFGAVVIPGPTVGLEYPPGCRQVLESELREELATQAKAKKSKKRK